MDRDEQAYAGKYEADREGAGEITARSQNHADNR